MQAKLGGRDECHVPFSCRRVLPAKMCGGSELAETLLVNH